MLPREFLGVYGTPVVRAKALAIGESFVIDPSPDRYLLIVITGVNAISLVPDIQSGTSIGGFQVAGAGQHIRFDHSHDGAMVNLGFRINNTAGPNTVTIIEGFMRPPTPKSVRKNNAAVDPKLGPRRRANDK